MITKYILYQTNDSKLIITPWDSINLKPENKIWNIYRSEILPFYSLTQDTYNPTSSNFNYTIKFDCFILYWCNFL